tara:strand:+ start:183 stop:659 length:477 start_codon:yes stop_codon:yes gene_type:complete
MFWPFGSKELPKDSPVSGIIQLMRSRPKEWMVDNIEFGGRSWYRIAKHARSGISLCVHYNYKTSATPVSISFHHKGAHPALESAENSALIKAFKRLQTDRINALAATYLKLENPVVCAKCEKRIKGWAWICKCQTALHQECYTETSVCPDCGGTLVDL